MKIKCLSNTGAGFSKYTLDVVGCTVNTRLPLQIGDIYVVYGQILSGNILKYLVKGTNENFPSWYPAEIFQVIKSQLPFEWYFRYCKGEEISAIWGFKELVNDKNYLYNLIEREEESIKIFLKRKKEIDEFEDY